MSLLSSFSLFCPCLFARKRAARATDRPAAAARRLLGPAPPERFHAATFTLVKDALSDVLAEAGGKGWALD
jgi:hypothetical protein